MSPAFSRIALYFGIVIPCAACDLETSRVPRAPLLILIILLIAGSSLSAPHGDVPADASANASLAGAASGMLAFLFVRKLTRNGLGLADVWMAGATGALGGPAFCATTVLAATALSLPAALPVLRKNPHKPIPFLPALASGAFYSLLIGFFPGKP